MSIWTKAALLAGAAFVFASGCSDGVGASARPIDARTVVSSNPLPAAGCGATPANQSSLPTWTVGANPPTNLPIVLSEEGNAAAFIYGRPMRAAPLPTGETDKILWVVREPRNGDPLVVTGHPVGATAPVVSKTFPDDGSGPGEIYPVYLPVPAAGCWHLTLQWGSNTAHIDLLYEP